MKIPDGICLKGDEVRRLLVEARSLLLGKGIQVPEIGPSWMGVVNWLRSRRTPRTAAQAAQCYLGLVSQSLNHIVHAADPR